MDEVSRFADFAFDFFLPEDFLGEDALELMDAEEEVEEDDVEEDEEETTETAEYAKHRNQMNLKKMN